MDWKCDLIEGKAWPTIILSSIEEDDTMVSPAQISQAEMEFIDNIFSPELTHLLSVYDEIHLATDEYLSNLANISSVWTPNTLYAALHRACEDSKYKISIGSKNVNTMKTTLDNDEYNII